MDAVVQLFDAEKLLAAVAFYVEKGGFVMPPLMVFTVVLWFGLGYRAFTLRRGNMRGARALVEKYAAGYTARPTGLIDVAVVSGLGLAQARVPDLRRQLDYAFASIEGEAGRFRTVVMGIVAIAPLTGLLGTVSGMIETFDSLADMALFTQSGGIAGGISEALFSTQMGLSVAIPGLFAGQLLNRREDALVQELALIKDILCSEYRQP